MKQHLRITLRLLSMAAALLLSLSAVAFAQEVTGSINGTVKDSLGAAVKGATVTITDSDKKVVVRTISTNDDGEFSARFCRWLITTSRWKHQTLRSTLTAR